MRKLDTERGTRLEEKAAKAQILTPAEFAVRSGRSKSFVEKLCRDGVLPARRIGTRYFLTVSDLVRDGWLFDVQPHDTVH